MILEVGELCDERSCDLQCTNHQMWKSSLGRVVFKITLHMNHWVAITTQKIVVIISGGSHDCYWVKGKGCFIL